jgi:hypothetical protein
VLCIELGEVILLTGSNKLLTSITEGITRFGVVGIGRIALRVSSPCRAGPVALGLGIAHALFGGKLAKERSLAVTGEAIGG